MTQFDNLLPIILRHEGVSATNPTGLVDIPGDTGGVTNWGISQTEWSRIYFKFTGFPTDVRNLTQDQATAIYKTIYYLPVCDELPPGPSMLIFDCEVNEGMGIKILQRSIGAIDDGQWGPDSERQLRLALRDIPKLCENILWARLQHYDSLARPDTATADRGFLAKLWIPRLIQSRAEARVLPASY